MYLDLDMDMEIDVDKTKDLNNVLEFNFLGVVTSSINIY